MSEYGQSNSTSSDDEQMDIPSTSQGSRNNPIIMEDSPKSVVQQNDDPDGLDKGGDLKAPSAFSISTIEETVNNNALKMYYLERKFMKFIHANILCRRPHKVSTGRILSVRIIKRLEKLLPRSLHSIIKARLRSNMHIFTTEEKNFAISLFETSRKG